jgi:uncharacterized repeat protein (TIGR03803 family)
MNYDFSHQTKKTARVRSLFVAANHKEAKRMRKLNFLLAAIFVLVLAVTLSPAQAQTQNFVALHQFNSQTDGAFSEGALLRDAAGNLYGTTTSGGPGLDNGTVFKIDSTGQEKVLFAFDAFISGDSPTGTLTQDTVGNLYGIAGGGPGGAGVIYRLSQQGEQQILFAFQGGLDNDNPKGPSGGLLLDKSGNLFGTAEFGSNTGCEIGCGSLFRLDTAGVLHLLHKFTSGSDGGKPIGPLVQDADGSLYGVAQSGGDLSCLDPDPHSSNLGCGTVFKFSRTTRVFTVLHRFHGGLNGSVPQGGLLLDGAGNLYGTTVRGGTNENGTVFQISKDGTYTVLHRFMKAEGVNPNGGLVLDESGNLFGTAQLGGALNLGTVFQLSPDRVLTVLHSFAGLEDGAVPFAGLIRDQAGHLFGTTVKNFLIQPIQGGNVFEIRP